MARLSSAPPNMSNRVKQSKKKSGSQISLLAATGFLLFIIIPFCLPVQWTGQLQARILYALRPYFPNYFPPAGPDIPIPYSQPQTVSLPQLLQECRTHQYTSEIISLDPLVIYINGFMSSREAEALIELGEEDFAESFISRSRGANVKAPGRTSSSAPLELEHPLVDCMLGRARRFMGSMMLPYEPFSIPQLVRYSPSQRYDLHTDFWPEHQIMNDGSNRLFNRVASFFVFMRDNCTEGYTYFPHVEPAHQSHNTNLEKLYGDKVARGELEGVEKGLKFKPIQGNAIFWVNVDEKGNGDRRLLHAGLPVGEGEKIGLNIWPRKYFGKVDEEPEVKKERKAWSGKWKN